MKYCVVTTINEPTDSILRLRDYLDMNDVELIIVGDTKTPQDYHVDKSVFLPVSDQTEFKIAKYLPTESYCRKMYGYLYAFGLGATSVFETDDDNFPDNMWGVIPESTDASWCLSKKWLNYYSRFTDKDVWPRGLPMQHRKEFINTTPELLSITSPLHQCLVSGQPDVDAIWRLFYGDGSMFFDPASPVVLDSWAPTNSQNTWWFKDAFPLMYLPTTCTFRATDIWRGLIAQRCLWEQGQHIIVHQADMVQHRNEHNLLNDFEQEIPLYLHNNTIVDLLEKLELGNDTYQNLRDCYSMMVDNGFLKQDEFFLLEAWIEDCKKLLNG